MCNVCPKILLLNKTEITCPPVSTIKNGFPDSNSDIIESVVTYSCLIGYRFSDGTTKRTTICLASQTWSATVEDCIRKKHIVTVAVIYMAT